MFRKVSRSEVCSPERVAPPPCKPPLDVVEQGYVWTVTEYQGGSRNGTTFSTHDSRFDAMSAAKERLEDEGHPCLLRWDDDESVGGLYWNPQFEDLSVRYDELLNTWVVTPVAGHFPFLVTDEFDEACEYGEVVQRVYDFKHLTAYDQDGNEHDSQDHRFLRNSITDSGVRFDSAMRRTATPEGGTGGTESDQQTGDTAAVPDALRVSIPDIAEVEVLDTGGLFNRFKSPWSDGSPVIIIVLSGKHATQEAVDAFGRCVDRWESVADAPTIASVYDSGDDPAPWIAYRAGERQLSDFGHELDETQRWRIVAHLCSAIQTIDEGSGHPFGISPDNVRLQESEGQWQAAVANWGIEWAVGNAVDDSDVTAYTAPEQIAGTVTERTVIYQLGALTYWLMTEQIPFSNAENLTRAIRTGDLNPPSAVGDVSKGVGKVIERAMEPQPEDRYRSVNTFYSEIQKTLAK